MKNSPLVSYLKSLIFKKLSLPASMWWIFISLQIIFLQLHLKTRLLIFFYLSNSACAGALVSCLIPLISFHYSDYKKYEYNKTKLPETKEEIKSSHIDPNVLEILKQQGERLTELEKNLHPLRLTIYCIFLAVALLIVARIIK